MFSITIKNEIILEVNFIDIVNEKSFIYDVI